MSNLSEINQNQDQNDGTAENEHTAKTKPTSLQKPIEAIEDSEVGSENNDIVEGTKETLKDIAI